jgi:carboxyl-terminal processing protease
VLKGFGGFQVVAVEHGSSAHDAGIEPGDQLRTIDGRDVSDFSLDQGIRAIRGEAGTTLEVELIHPGDGFRRETVELVRRVPNGSAYDIDLRSGTAVVTLRQPERVDLERLRRELGDAASSGATRLLIDVRNVVVEDPRGIAGVAGLFVRGELLRLRTRSEDEPLDTVRLEADPFVPAWEGELGVLVNGGTAGGAEALAQILKTRVDAIVFGEPTYGLGSEPRLYRLPDGSGVLLAADIWELEDGETWDRDGIRPDEEIRGVGSKLSERMSDQIDKTLLRFAGEAETPAAA